MNERRSMVAKAKVPVIEGTGCHSAISRVPVPRLSSSVRVVFASLSLPNAPVTRLSIETEPTAAPGAMSVRDHSSVRRSDGEERRALPSKWVSPERLAAPSKDMLSGADRSAADNGAVPPATRNRGCAVVISTDTTSPRQIPLAVAVAERLNAGQLIRPLALEKISLSRPLLCRNILASTNSRVPTGSVGSIPASGADGLASIAARAAAMERPMRPPPQPGVDPRRKLSRQTWSVGRTSRRCVNTTLPRSAAKADRSASIASASTTACAPPPHSANRTLARLARNTGQMAMSGAAPSVTW